MHAGRARKSSLPAPPLRLLSWAALGPACRPLSYPPPLPTATEPSGRTLPDPRRIVPRRRESCGFVHGDRCLFRSSRGGRFVVSGFRVKEAPKRNLKRNSALPEPQAMRLGPPGASAAAVRTTWPFPSSRELVLILSPLIESRLSTPVHPGYVFSQTWIFL